MYTKLLTILILLAPTLVSGVSHKRLNLPPENTVVIYGCGEVRHYPPHQETTLGKILRLSEDFDKQIDLMITIGMSCNQEILWYEVIPTADIID